VRDDDGGPPLGHLGERILNDEFRFRVDAGRG
jgi:dGTP triphosphohydrolase